MRLSKIIIFILVLKINGICSIFEGQIPEPFFNKKGELACIYKNSDGKILLENIEQKEIFVLPLGKNVFSPLIKKDRKGKIWLVWEEWDKHGSKILIGKFKEKRKVSIYAIIGEKGFNYSPDLFFDENNSPWLTWINWDYSQYRIFVRQIFSDKKWIIDSLPFSSISTPKIVVNKRVRVFWSGKYIGEEGVYFKEIDCRNRLDFHIGKINKTNIYPNLNPQIVMANRGIIWVIWVGYDGHDYEIYCKLWDGNNWLEEIKITDNSENDIFPSLSLLNGEIPIIAWAKSGEKGSEICIKFFKGNSWSKEIRISSPGINNFPKIICEKEKIGLVWNSLNEVKAKIFYINQVRNLNKVYFYSAPYRRQIIYNSLLQENKYIGFGDSITYGYINHESFPEKGYIPRLKDMLNKNFGETEVLNEGFPAEVTQGGLSRIETILKNDFAQYLLLMEGTNDIIFMEISMDTTAFNLREMVKRCIEYGVFPSIATIIPRKDWAWYFDFFRKRIFYLNDKIKEIAKEFSIPLTDQFNAFFNYPEGDGGWKSLLSEDGKHPNEKGYQVMAEKWFEEIRKFPFPPINFNAKRVINEILFYKEEINYLKWKDSPKIEEDYIAGYKIYRKKEGEEVFTLIDIVYNGHEYLDRKINPREKYSYLISTLRKDGVEGPCTGPVKDY